MARDWVDTRTPGRPETPPTFDIFASGLTWTFRTVVAIERHKELLHKARWPTLRRTG